MHSLNLAEVLVGAAKAGRAQEMLADLHAIGIHVADRQDGEPTATGKPASHVWAKTAPLLRTGRRDDH
jgi:hypothetical protein